MRLGLRHLRYIVKPHVAAAILREQLHLRRNRGFLGGVRGVIHIGANFGNERDEYARHDLPVIWVEAIPEAFAELQANLVGFPKQTGFQYLMLDRDGVPTAFHIANNQGGSSSVFDLAQHRDIWPEVEFVRDITLDSITLPTMVQRHGIDLRLYDTIVLDTQGSELLILKGAQPLLKHFRYIKTEVADFPSYEGGALLSEMNSFMADNGFRVWARIRFAHPKVGGSYFDVIYKKRALA
jgi:2-O-methyltransferase